MNQTNYLILAALAPAIILCIYIFKMDRNEKEPVSLLLKLLLYGALGCLPVIFIGPFLEKILTEIFSSYIINGQFISVETKYVYNFFKYFIVVALVEEGVKWFIMQRQTKNSKEFNSLFDGIIYAVFVSLGFAAFENVLYVVENGWTVAIMRAVLSVPGHMFYGIMMGYHYSMVNIFDKAAKYEESFINQGFITQSGPLFSSTGHKIKCLLVPTVAHGLYDYLCTFGTSASLLLLFAFVIFMYVHCFRKVIRMSKADKSDMDCISMLLFRKYPGLYEKLNEMNQ